MSIEAIRQVTETEQANKQSRAAAEAEAHQLVLDAERNGTELLKKVRSDAAEQGKDLLREAEAESRRQREQAEQHLDETAEFIVERVVKH
jgi:V/A-type H+-transporting ATPase subunit G/H